MASCLILLCSAGTENLVLMRIMLPPWGKAMIILLTWELRLPSDQFEVLMLWNQQAKRRITEVVWVMYPDYYSSMETREICTTDTSIH